MARRVVGSEDKADKNMARIANLLRGVSHRELTFSRVERGRIPWVVYAIFERSDGFFVRVAFGTGISSDHVRPASESAIDNVFLHEAETASALEYARMC